MEAYFCVCVCSVCGLCEAEILRKLKLCLIKMKYSCNVALVFLMRHIYTSYYLFGRERDPLQIYFSAFLTVNLFILSFFVPLPTPSFPRSFLCLFLLVSSRIFSLLLHFISHNVILFRAPPFLIIFSLKNIFRNEAMEDFYAVLHYHHLPYISIQGPGIKLNFFFSSYSFSVILSAEIFSKHLCYTVR